MSCDQHASRSKARRASRSRGVRGDTLDAAADRDAEIARRLSRMVAPAI